MDGSQEITQTLPSIPPREKPLIMIMGEPTYIPKYESSIPRQVTDRILQKEQLRVELPGLGSSIIEDYLIEQVKGGVIDSEEIAANFERQNIGAKVRAFAERARRTSESLDWSETFTLDDARIAQVKVVAEMQNMGMTPEQIAAVAKMDVEIGEGIGVSSLSEHGVYVSRLQAIRKAIDYQELYGSDIPLQTIVRAIMTNTIGHELGHKVDDVASVAVNRIRADDSWKKGDDSGESKSERFAEFWGRASLGRNHELLEIIEKERALQVAKVAQMWDAVSSHNSANGQQLDLMEIFRAIDGKIDKADETTSSIFFARRIFYSSHGPENYAIPYERDIVTQAVKPKAD